MGATITLYEGTKELQQLTDSYNSSGLFAMIEETVEDAPTPSWSDYANDIEKRMTHDEIWELHDALTLCLTRLTMTAQWRRGMGSGAPLTIDEKFTAQAKLVELLKLLREGLKGTRHIILRV